MKDRINTIEQLFKALGDSKRLKIIKLLASNMNETLCVSDIAKFLKITQPGASQHIKILKNSGILDENRRGYRVFYNINNDILHEYKTAVDDLFKKAFVKCPYDLDCSKCSYNNNCG